MSIKWPRRSLWDWLTWIGSWKTKWSSSGWRKFWMKLSHRRSLSRSLFRICSINSGMKTMINYSKDSSSHSIAAYWQRSSISSTHFQETRLRKKETKSCFKELYLAWLRLLCNPIKFTLRSFSSRDQMDSETISKRFGIKMTSSGKLCAHLLCLIAFPLNDWLRLKYWSHYLRLQHSRSWSKP